VGDTGTGDARDRAASHRQSEANCWQGKPSQRPANNDDIKTGIKKVENAGPNSDKTNILALRLPENRDWGDNNKALGRDHYTCNFGLQQRITSSDYKPTVDDVFTSTGSLIGEITDCDSGTCYIIAGSNSIKPITVKTNEKQPTDNIQITLEKANTNTQTNTLTNNIFGTFPEGGLGRGDVGDRNPLEVCRERHGCPEPQ